LWSLEVGVVAVIMVVVAGPVVIALRLEQAAGELLLSHN
jgi:hypothetical protein